MNPISHIIKPSTQLVLDLLKDSKSGLSLKDNQVVEAKVIRLLTQGKAQLLIDNKTVDVKSHVPLSEGETLYLKVTKIGDSQVLKLVESHKPVLQSPGLDQVRALGQKGPYDDLAKIINAPLEQKTSTGRAAPQAGVPVKQGTGPMDVPLPSGGKNLPAQAAGQTQQTSFSRPQADPSPLNAFTTKTAIPLELKLALLMTQKTPDMPNIPGNLINDLSARLERILQQAKDVPGNENKASQPMPAEQKQAIQLLGNRARSLLSTLALRDKHLVAEVLKNRSLPTVDKIAALIKATEATPIRDAGLNRIKDGIVKVLFPKGIPAGMPQLSQIKAQASAPTAPFPQAAMDSSVFSSKSLLGGLKELITTMALKPGTPFNADTLRNLVKNSGLLWERKLRTVVESQIGGKNPTPLKEQLASLLRQDVKALSMNAHESGKPEVEKTVETLKRFVDNVEKLQVLNSHGSEESGRYLLPLPFFSGEKLKFGQLFIDTDKKRKADKNKEDRIIRVAFLLDMSQLGHVEADFSIFKKALSGEFVVGNQSAKTLLDEAFPVFRAALTHKGYTVSKMECRLENPDVLSSRSLADRMVTPEDGAVSILI